MIKRTIRNYGGEAVGSTVHVFELAGLGKAPFTYMGCYEKTYQACADAPVQPGGLCHFCGQGIRYVCAIRSSDGKEFTVGCDCVRKTGDEGLRRVVDAAKKEIERKKVHEKQDARIARAKEILPRVADQLRMEPHPNDWRASKGETRYDYVFWMLHYAGRSGGCQAAAIVEALPRKEKE